MLKITRHASRHGSTPYGAARGRRWRIVRRAVVAAALLFAAGWGYVWYDHNQEPSPATTYIKRTPAGVPPVPAAPPKVVIEHFAARVLPGGTTTMKVRTDPNVDCTIKVIYGPGRTIMTGPGLAPKKSAADGAVAWSWTVPPATPPGTWPATVTCGGHAHPGRAVKNLIVLPQPAN